MAALRSTVLSSLRRLPTSAVLQRRGYAEAAAGGDKLKLSLVLPHSVCGCRVTPPFKLVLITLQIRCRLFSHQVMLRK
jgi:hypothetical protein